MTEPTPQDNEHDGPLPLERNGVPYVALKLAHPLSKDDAIKCQALVKKDYNVGNIIRVTREWGNSLIGGGRVQVDPIDKKAVRAALFLNDRDQPLTAEEIAGPSQPAPAAAQNQPAPAAVEPDAAVPARTEPHQSAADVPSSESPKAAAKAK